MDGQTAIVVLLEYHPTGGVYYANGTDFLDTIYKIAKIDNNERMGFKLLGVADVG